jgi:hypothetical protein
LLWIHSSPHSLVGHTHIPAKHPLKLIWSSVFVCVHNKYRNTESFMNFMKKFGAISHLFTIGQNEWIHYGKTHKQLHMHFQTTETCTLSHIKKLQKKEVMVVLKRGLLCSFNICVCVCVCTHLFLHAFSTHKCTHNRKPWRIKQNVSNWESNVRKTRRQYHNNDGGGAQNKFLAEIFCQQILVKCWSGQTYVYLPIIWYFD